jgi:hypothetical protein
MSGEDAALMAQPLSANIGSTMGDSDADAARAQVQVDAVSTTTSPASSSSASSSPNSTSSAHTSFAPSRLLIFWFLTFISSFFFLL